MTFGGELIGGPDEPYGAFVSRRLDGYVVLDVNGPFALKTQLPSYSVCLTCKGPLFERFFSVEEIPLPEPRRVARCESGHEVRTPDFFTLFDNTPLMEPRLLHVRRPTETELLGTGWLTRKRADGLYEAARILAAAEDPAQVEAAMNQAVEALPALSKLRGRNRPWTRGEIMAALSIVIAVLAVVLPFFHDDGTASRMIDIIERQQEILERQVQDPDPDPSPSS